MSPTEELIRTADEAWKVLETSGYIKKWCSHVLPEDLEEQYKGYWSKTRDDSFTNVVYSAAGEAVATSAATRQPDGAWMLHQLAAVPAKEPSEYQLRKEVAEAIFMAIDRVPMGGRIVVYSANGGSLDKRLYHDFVEGGFGGPAASIKKYFVYRVRWPGTVFESLPGDRGSAYQMAFSEEGCNVFGLGDRAFTAKLTDNSFRNMKMAAWFALKKSFLVFTEAPVIGASFHKDYLGQGLTFEINESDADMYWKAHIASLTKKLR